MKYTLEDIVKHPVQLVKVQLKDVHVSKYQICEDCGEITREITVSTNSTAENDELGYVEATMTISAIMNGEKYYDAVFTYIGECKNSKESSNEREFEIFLEVQAIRLIWPYFRETVPSILLKMGTEPFEIPTIDVFETISKNINRFDAYDQK